MTLHRIDPAVHQLALQGRDAAARASTAMGGMATITGAERALGLLDEAAEHLQAARVGLTHEIARMKADERRAVNANVRAGLRNVDILVERSGEAQERAA